MTKESAINCVVSALNTIGLNESIISDVKDALTRDVDRVELKREVVQEILSEYEKLPKEDHIIYSASYVIRMIEEMYK